MFQYKITAPKDGVVKRVLYSEGDTVKKGMLLVEFETEKEEEAAVDDNKN